MSCTNYTATQIPVSVGFDANGNAGSLVETKEIKVTKIETPTDVDQLIIQSGGDGVYFQGNIIVEGSVQATQGVTITGASAISGMSDTLISTPIADNEVLAWDTTAGKWINQTASEAGLVVPGDLSVYATTASLANYATTGSLANYATTASLTGYLATTAINNSVQAYDIALQAISQVTPAADRLPYFTGAGTAQVTTLTNTARTLLDDTTIGGMQATLGVRPGLDVQVQNTNLQNIADIQTGFLNTDDVIAWDGANWIAQAAPGGGGPIALDQLSDVTAPSPGNNDFLVYDTGTTDWVNKTPAQARTSLGATTVGNNIITVTPPVANTYLRINSNDTVTPRTYAQVRDDLDVVPGENVQAYDAGLQSIANLNLVANTLVYFTATDAAATSPLTEFGRSLLDDANATECRGTLSAQVSALSLNNIKDICDATGPAAFGRLLYTVPNGVIGGVNILPVPLFDPAIIANNYGKVLSLRDPGGGVYAQPQFQFLFFGELGNVNLGGGAGQGGDLTPGRILYVNESENLTELANPAGTSFLRHNGNSTGPTWRSAADVRTDIGAQASDPTLTALAGVTTANDTIIYFNGVDSATSTGLTAAGRKIISCPDTLATGDIFYYDGTNVKKLGKPTNPAALVFGDGENAPKWVQVPDKTGTYFLKSTAGALSWGGV